MAVGTAVDGADGGKGLALYIDTVAPEVDVRQIAAVEGVIPDGLDRGCHIHLPGTAAVKSVGHNGDHPLPVNGRGDMIGGLFFGHAGDDDVVFAARIGGGEIIAGSGGAVRKDSVLLGFRGRFGSRFRGRLGSRFGGRFCGWLRGFGRWLGCRLCCRLCGWLRGFGRGLGGGLRSRLRCRFCGGCGGWVCGGGFVLRALQFLSSQIRIPRHKKSECQ